jgi:hypothetical protein
MYWGEESASCEQAKDRSIPADRADTWSTDQVRETNLGIIRTVGLLDQDRPIHHLQHRQVIQAVSDPDRQEPVPSLSGRPPV